MTAFNESSLNINRTSVSIKSEKKTELEQEKTVSGHRGMIRLQTVKLKDLVVSFLSPNSPAEHYS